MPKEQKRQRVANMKLAPKINYDEINKRDEIFKMWDMIDKFAEEAKRFYAYKGTIDEDITAFAVVNGKKFRIEIKKIGEKV